jgi:hypothetical protein
MSTILVAPLVVSQSQGNDATAARFGSPYQTLGAAKSAALAGDTIVVMDGTFNERDLLKNNVHWYFMAGTKVLYTGPNPNQNDRAIFDDSGGAVACRIDGYGEFVWGGDNGLLTTAGGNSGGVLWLQNSASAVSIRGYRASIYLYASIGQDTYTLFVENCAQFFGNFEIVETEANPGGAVGWFDGDFNLVSKIIRASTSSYTVWAREPSGGVSKNGYIEADLIDNPSYAAVRLEGTSASYKLWIRAKEIRGRSGGASNGAIQQSGGGKLYLDAEKIDNTSLGAPNAYVRLSPAIYVTGGEAWVRAQKITTNLNVAMAPRYMGQAVTCDATTNKVSLAAHGLTPADQVRFGGTAVPTGLTAGTKYWVVNPTANDFQVSATQFGAAVAFTSRGTAITLDVVPFRYTRQAVTCNSTTDRITLPAHGFTFADQVRFGGTTVPAGLIAGVWYFVVNVTANDFQVSLTFAGAAVDFTANGSGVTIDSIPWAACATVLGGTVFLDGQHFELSAGPSGSNYAADAFCVAGADAILRVRGQIMSPVLCGCGIVHSGGSSRFTGLLLDTRVTNAPRNRPVEISAPGLVLEQCKLIAPPSADSVYAATAQSVTCYGVYANRAKNANVTVNVEAIVVDANTV